MHEFADTVDTTILRILIIDELRHWMHNDPARCSDWSGLKPEDLDSAIGVAPPGRPD